jgi:amino acid transporter
VATLPGPRADASRTIGRSLRSRLRRAFGGPSGSGGGLGTFLGVYTPTVLTILGVILYLRLGWVVGQAGLARTLLIVVVANSITLVTALALSAVATNSRVGVGGAYYIISRSLGLEVGGAVGLPLFLSQVFSVTLYAYGLAESLRFVWPEVPVQATAFVIVAAVGALAFRGAGTALRTQVPILALIALSVVALAAGVVRAASPGALAASAPSGEYGFWTVFAVFFPAVTGIMAGLGLSGDLADPKRAIPRGALAAQLTGFAVYLLVPVGLALAVAPETLRDDPLVWTTLAPGGAWLVLPGLWGAIFSSAVGSMLGAPRTLQALARDHLAPSRLGAAGRHDGEPRAGLWIATGLALAAVALGDLNTVAAVVTMFFLTVYGILNLAAALEELSGDPSWRPAIRVPWPLFGAAALACFGAMLLIDAAAAVVAVVVVVGLWALLQRRERRASWGDVRRGVYEALVRWALVRLARRPMTARSWRPHILVFTQPVEDRIGLVRFGDWFSQDRGVVTVCELIVGDLMTLEADLLERRTVIQRRLGEAGIVAFAEVNVVPDIVWGIVSVAQANGMAGIESNTVMLGWPSSPAGLAAMLPALERLARIHKSLIVGRAPEDARPRRHREVHVWWGGLQRNGDLLLLLAYLLCRNPEWRDARIRVLSVASNALMKSETERALARLLPEIRIRADVEVRVRAADESVRDVIHAESADADLVLLGLATPTPGEEAEYAERLFELAEGLRGFFFVRNNSLFIGDLVSAEELPPPGRIPTPRAPAPESDGDEGEDAPEETRPPESDPRAPGPIRPGAPPAGGPAGGSR